MRILCTSDLHGNLTNLDFHNIDVVIIAGDIAPTYGFGKWHIYKQKKWIQDVFCNLAKNTPTVEFILIPGNHDMALDPMKKRTFHDVDLTIMWPKNVHLLINEYIHINDLNIYGTPNVPIINHMWSFESDHQTLSDAFRKIPTNIDILISHCPPHIPNSQVDYSIQTDRGPFGSSELTEQIMISKPKYVICGHIHSGDHQPTQFDETTIYNVSRVNEDYEIEYKPLILEI